MLTPIEFADAVRKGMGRAVLAVDGPVSKEFEEIILTACLEDQRYDRQCEDSRSHYLMSLVEKAGLADKLLPSLLEPINESMSDWDQLHRIRMLGQFARRSEPKSWEILTTKGLAGNTDAWEVIAEIGNLEWLVENILSTLPLDEQWRVGGWLEENKGKTGDAVDRLLVISEKNNESVAKARGETKIMIPPTYEMAIASIQGKNLFSPFLRAIGRDLTDDQVLEVANLWLKERDHRRGRNYKRLFDVREFPLPAQVVVDLIERGDMPIAFEEVLFKSEDPLVRRLGLKLITQPDPDYRGYLCLGFSHRDEDLPIMEQNLDRFINAPKVDIHSLGMNVMKTAKNMTKLERLPFLIWIYEHTPCSMCRTSVAEDMIKDGLLPASYHLELLYDADDHAREIAEKNT